MEAALALARAPAARAAQAPLASSAPDELVVVVQALALGGAERIVVDWAARVRGRYRVRLAVLRTLPIEYPVPDGVAVSRMQGAPDALEAFARTLAAGAIVLCHLLDAPQRIALRRGGAIAVPVVHNARAGWIDSVPDLRAEPLLVAVSQACADELRTAGVTGVIHVVRHVPQVPAPDPAARARWRIAWGVPGDALLVGMIGGIKPQKAYPFALRVCEALARSAPGARMAIVGGPAGRDGTHALQALRAQRERLGLARDVVLAGPVPDAAQCLPAFDVLLNTSLHEGLSIATLEALVSGLPVVASRVGGQGELPHGTLALVHPEAEPAQWAEEVLRASRLPRTVPAWARFPAYRLWTLAHLAAPYPSRPHVLFVTANLNAGGAQRSLVNLAAALAGQEAMTVAVTGNSTSGAFLGDLVRHGVDVVRTADSRDPFDHAEALLALARSRRSDIVVFWNVDAKVKLLFAKFAAAMPSLRLVDVSPGEYAFEELAATGAFQQWIAFDAGDYGARLDGMVHKFEAATPAWFRKRATVVRNGVPLPGRIKTAYATCDAPRIAVNGRIAPSKFVREILEAFRIVLARHPHATLHLYGSVEPRHAEYARAALGEVHDLLGTRVFLHGEATGVPAELGRHDAAVVLGIHQGCPNACLEALAAGVPVVANDSGGTREIVVDGSTGWLVRDTDPRTVANAILEVLADPDEARRRGQRGRAHVTRRFAMDAMVKGYRRLFRQLRKGRTR